MTSEKLYTSEEVSALFGLKESGVYQYHKRFNLGTLKKIERENIGRKYSIGEIIGTWRLLERKAGENRTMYLVECVKCGFKREFASSQFSNIAAGKCKNKCKECARLVKEQEAQWIKEMAKLHGRGRCSGQTYKNSPERIAEIKAKYANGVPAGEIEKWLGV